VSPAISGNVNKQDEIAIAFATADGFLFLLDNQLNTKPGFPVRLGQRVSTPLAMADIDGDGTRDIIAFSENKIFVYNYAGASLDNFPKTVAFASPILSNPVVADVDGDGNVEVVAVSDDGLVVAYDKTGRLAPGFPLQAGRGRQSVAAFAFTQAPPLHHVGLAVASSEDGSVVAWRTTSYPFDLSHVFIPPQPWPQYQGDERHTGIALGNLGGSPVSAAFFPKERAYNWPNPVYDGKTYIRYFISEKATVKIKILDLAGDLVTEFDGPGVAGVDNEVEWNVKDVQSGVYLARIEATGSGKSEVAVVKVAVVK
jgi:hypothetical protein